MFNDVHIRYILSVIDKGSRQAVAANRAIQTSTEKTSKAAIDANEKQIRSMSRVDRWAAQSTQRAIRGNTEVARSHSAVGRSMESVGRHMVKLMGHGRGLTRNLAAFNIRFTAIRNSLLALSIPAVITFFGLFAQSLAAAGGAAVALVSSLGPLVGLLAVIPNLAGGAAFAINTVKAAFMGVGDTLKAYDRDMLGAGRAATKSGKDMEAAAEGVRSAEEALAAAKERSKRAEEDLSGARREAKKDIVDLALASQEAATAEGRARLALAQARAELERTTADPGATGFDQQSALLGVQEASEGLRRAHIERGRAASEAAQAEANGVERSKKVVDAKRAERDALKGIADAQRQLQQAMKKEDAGPAASGAADRYAAMYARLSKEQKHFVDFYKKNVYPVVQDQIPAAAAKNFLPGVETGIKGALRNLPLLEKALNKTGGVLGGFAARAGKYLGGDVFGGAFAKLTAHNDKWIQTLGDSIFRLSKAFVQLTTDALPLTDWIAKSTAHLIDQASAWSESAHKSGKFKDMLDDTRVVLSRLGRIVGDTTKALFNIFSGGKKLGDDLLVSLVKNADKFREWTESAGGQNKIRKFFVDIKPTVYELTKLVRDLVKAFVHMGTHSGVDGVIKALRTQLLPALTQIIEATSKAFGPALINLLTSVVSLIQALQSPLAIAFNLMALFGRALTFLLNELPGVKLLVSTLAALAVVMAGVQFFAWVTGVSAAMRAIGRLVAGWRAVQTTSTQAALAQTAAARAAGVPVGAAGGKFYKGGQMLPGGGRAPKGGGTYGPGGEKFYKGGQMMPGGGRAPAGGAFPNQAGKAAGKFGKFGKLLAGAGGAASVGMLGGPVGIGLTAAVIAAPVVVPLLIKAFGSKDASYKPGKGFEVGDVGRGVTVAGATGPRGGPRGRVTYDAGVLKLRKFADEVNRVKGNLGGLSAEKLNELRTTAKKLAGEFPKASGALEAFAKDVDSKLVRPLNSSFKFVDDGWEAMSKSTAGHLKDIKERVKINTNFIAGSLDTKSDEGRKALSRNFDQAAKAIKEAMKDGRVSTRTGLREIQKLMERQLQMLGYNKDQAKDLATSGNLRATSNTDRGRFERNAGGGWIGKQGQVSGDMVPALLGYGEAVLNRHQQGPVESALQQTYGMGLDDLFTQVQTPHYAAKGGMIGYAGGGFIKAPTTAMKGTAGKVVNRTFDIAAEAANRKLDKAAERGDDASPGKMTGGIIKLARHAAYKNKVKWDEEIVRLLLKKESAGGKNLAPHHYGGILDPAGPFQVISSTFRAHAWRGHTNRMNPYDNALAAFHYIKERYGSLENLAAQTGLDTSGYKGYKTGKRGKHPLVPTRKRRRRDPGSTSQSDRAFRSSRRGLVDGAALSAYDAAISGITGNAYYDEFLDSLLGSYGTELTSVTGAAAKQTNTNKTKKKPKTKRKASRPRTSKYAYTDGLTNMDGFQVANWIAVILKAARADGVNFNVSSGFRTFQKQTQLWNDLGRDPAIVARPGTSNHEGYKFPRGAVDLGDPGWRNMVAWLGRHPVAGARLKHYGNPRDPYHFSNRGNARGGFIGRYAKGKKGKRKRQAGMVSGPVVAGQGFGIPKVPSLPDFASDLEDMSARMPTLNVASMVGARTAALQRITAMQKGGITPEEATQIARLQATMSLFEAGLGQYFGGISKSVMDATKGFETDRTKLSQMFRTNNVDESSSNAQKMLGNLLADQVKGLETQRDKLAAGVTAARNAGVNDVADRMQEQLNGINADIAETTVQSVEALRAAIMAKAQEGVNAAAHTGAMNAAGLTTTELQQKLNKTFDTTGGRVARAEQIRGTIIPGLQGELTALEGQKAAALETNNKALADQIAESIAGKGNEILAAQLEAQELIEQNTREMADALKEFGGSTAFEFRNSPFTDLVNLGNGT